MHWHLFFMDLWRRLPSALGHNSAQTRQRNHEVKDVCTAKCPSTQKSGKQGTTILNIDMLWASGIFLVEYEMYENPDQLTIEYEGKVIFDTGGLVSGAGSEDVKFGPGSSTKIKVTIHASNEGTEWDLTVNCPHLCPCQ
jgi:hypothetical protein